MAKAATLTIVEAEHIVPIGSIDPNDVDLPGIFVDRIVPATDEKHIEIKKLRENEGVGESAKGEAQVQRERIARRAAKELKQGYYANLGVGEYKRTRLNIPLTIYRYPHIGTVLLTQGRQGLGSVRKWNSGNGKFPQNEIRFILTLFRARILQRTRSTRISSMPAKRP